jgi:carboxyl-terminal processing protease
MLPASNRGAGQHIGFPDVCNTPVGPATAPIPYPNIALTAQAVGFSQVVKVSMLPALNIGSRVPMTLGDEAGVAHPTIKGPGQYTMGNPIISIDRLPAIHLTCPTTGNNMNNALGAVLVPSATNVLFCRAGADSSLDDTIERVEWETLGAELSRSSVGGARLLDERIGYIEIRHFGGDATAGVHASLVRLRREGAEVFVLDLRANPGGELAAALHLAEDFVTAGALLATIVDADGDAVERRARRAAPVHVEPVVILIDGQTASAAELFAAILRDHDRAIVVGERSYGKRCVQRMECTATDGLRRTTVGAWYPPSGGEPDGDGIEPDVPVEVEGAADDAGLRAAAEVARELLRLG